MTLEERVEALEEFIGNMNRIRAVYANSLQAICDKYLSPLYIATYDSTHKNYLTIANYPGAVETVNDIPRNVIFDIRPSHDLDMTGETVAKLRFQGTIIEDGEPQVKILEFPLRKFDPNSQGNLIELSSGDFLYGITYPIYINSQGVAIISTSDTGTRALSEIAALENVVDLLQTAVEGLSTSATITSLTSSTAEITNLHVGGTLTLGSGAVVLPSGSTCSIPTTDGGVANKQYVDNQIAAKINEYHNRFHIFGTAEASAALSPDTVPNNAIYYRYQ